MKSVQPFSETARPLLEMSGLSGRRLTERLRERGFSRDQSTIARLLAGEYPPSPAQIEQFAAVFGVTPETFAEYRLWKVRCEYDPTVIPWNRAIRNLKRAEEG